MEPGGATFNVAHPSGLLRLFPDAVDETRRAVLVMIGEPRIRRPAHVKDGQSVDALTVKANTIVAWVDRRGFPELGALGGLGRPPPGAEAGGVALEPTASVVPEFLLGIYAEGAVEMVFGDLVFRAETLYVEPHEYKALLVEPRFDGKAVGVGNVDDPLPLHVRARRARLLAKGLTLFDDAEVSSSRAEDRIALRVKRLSVREYESGVTEQGAERPHFLGYQSTTSQWYSGRTVTGHGERLPLFWLPAAEFGVSEDTQALVQPLKRIRAGNVAQLGRFLFVRVGDSLGPDRDPLVDWFFEAGGYTERGVAGGVDLVWDHMDDGAPIRGFGRIESWAVVDDLSTDSDGFVHGRDVRGRVVAESRTYLRDDLLLDVEFNHFSDRGFNNEFFERDDLQHKDRESYARLRYAPERPGNVVATLDAKWHQRRFVTETTELPQAGVWVLPVPLVTPGRRGGLGVDVTSESEAGYLGRRFDAQLADPDYETWRFHSDTRLNAGFDVGDLRISGYAGAAGTIYEDRTDGRDDLTRTAFLGGLRANLQLHRTYGASGTWFQLDGLRHVVDVDAEYMRRDYDSHEPADLPFLDELEAERERTAWIVRVRNRLQTREGQAPSVAPGQVDTTAPRDLLRTVADLEVSVKRYVDEIGPFGRDSPGAVDLSFYGRPRSNVDLAGETEIDFADGILTGSVGAGVRTSLQDRPLTLFTGVRSVRGESLSLTADLSWRFSERYALRLRQIVDFKGGEDLTRVLFRRYSPDHIIVFGVSLRNNEDIGIEFSIEPAIGGRTTEGPDAFKDEPDTNPWGAFR